MGRLKFGLDPHYIYGIQIENGGEKLGKWSSSQAGYKRYNRLSILYSLTLCIVILGY